MRPPSNPCVMVDTLVVDKTGTLTDGHPTFDRVIAAEGFAKSGHLARTSAGSLPTFARSLPFPP